MDVKSAFLKALNAVSRMGYLDSRASPEKFKNNLLPVSENSNRDQYKCRHYRLVGFFTEHCCGRVNWSLQYHTAGSHVIFPDPI